MRKLVWVGVLTLLVLGVVAAVGEAAENRFGDDDGSVHEPALGALNWVGVLAGTECGTAAICPGAPIDRWTMAVWLTRARDYPDNRLWWAVPFAVYNEQYRAYLEAPLHEREPVTETRFGDIDVDDWRATYVEALAVEGITSGCKAAPPEFCPDRSVTRAQMATFLVRAFNLEDGDQAFEFTDIAGTTHEENIRRLASVGVTAGCATEPLRFCPDAPVTRGQMATFLVRAMGRAQSLPDPNPGDTVDCEDFATQGEAQVFFDKHYLYYGDVAMLDDGNRPLEACESLPGDPWEYLKSIDPIDDEVSPYLVVTGTKDSAADWEDRPYLGVNCWGSFVNLRDNFYTEEVSVEFRFYPDGDPVSESWEVSEEGRSTFLYPPTGGENNFYDQLVADNAEELRIRIEFDVYRFDVTNFTAARQWLNEQCEVRTGWSQGGWPGWERPDWA